VVQDFYLWRNRLIVDSFQDSEHLVMDGTYHDISTTLITSACYSELHDHEKIGAGRWMTQAVRDMQAELIGSQGRRAYSIGIENATEVVLDQIDYYHLGDVGVGPIRARTLSSTYDQPKFSGINKWMMQGDAVDIPLFAFAYHPYGAMRTGGKIQISYEMGDIFYWATASEYLWGGILELIYFNTPVDILPGIDTAQVDCPDGWPCAFQTGWASGPGGNQGWYYGEDAHVADPDKIDFLKKAAYLRIVAAPEYLVSGRMMMPPVFAPEPDTVDYSYDFYSHIVGENFEHTGTYAAPAILAQAWQTWDGSSTAITLANPTDLDRDVTLEINLADYGLDQTTLTRIDTWPPLTQDQSLGACTLDESCAVTLTIPARSFELIELQ
jgi:hypothetical protein